MANKNGVRGLFGVLHFICFFLFSISLTLILLLFPFLGNSYSRDKLKTLRTRAHRTAEAFTFRAMCYYARKNDLEKIERVLEKALQVDPNFIPALILRANVLLEHGQPARALPYFSKAMEVIGRTS